MKNVTFLQADITDSKAMLAAADDVSKATGGSLDLLIPNAAVAGEKNRFKSLADFPSLEDIEADLNETFNVNVVGVAFTINAFLPLIRKGQMKKIAAISTGMAMDQWTNNLEIKIAATYSVSKAALNMLVVKYSVALKKENILVFGISPGYVGTDMNVGGEMDEEAMQAVQELGAAFMKVKPDWNGQPLTAEESVNMVAKVIQNATIAEMGGDMVSHHGNKTDWL